MPIEKDLKDNTAALNANTAILQKLYDIKKLKGAEEYVDGINEAVAAPAPVAAKPAPAAPAATAAPAAAVAQPAATPAPVQTSLVALTPAPVQTSLVALTPEQMNQALVAEFQRVGNRAPIDAAMTALGVTSVNDLPADKQQELLATVRAIPGAA